MPRAQRNTESVSRGRGRMQERMARGRRTVSEGQYQKAFTRWKNGEHIADLAADLGVRRGTLRHYLTKLAGGPEEFKALRNEGVGGLRASLGERPKRPSIDKHARVIPAGKRRNWKYRSMRDGEETIPVFVAPTRGGGKEEYVPAMASQKADVIAEMGNGLPPARLVRLIRPTAKA